MKFTNRKFLLTLFALGSISMANADLFRVNQRYSISKGKAVTFVYNNLDITALDNDILIYSITANRGNCFQEVYNRPRKIGYGETITITKSIESSFDNGSACKKILEVEINTNKGKETLTFDF